MIKGEYPHTPASSNHALPFSISQGEPITFCEEAFVSHYRSGAMRQFLQNATQLQLFKQVPGLPSLASV